MNPDNAKEKSNNFGSQNRTNQKPHQSKMSKFHQQTLMYDNTKALQMPKHLNSSMSDGANSFHESTENKYDRQLLITHSRRSFNKSRGDTNRVMNHLIVPNTHPTKTSRVTISKKSHKILDVKELLSAANTLTHPYHQKISKTDL